ncbi:unnamed protein product [Lupinus luteus]|uniref:Uncharacterized protein n=1 Tax=Lupinus luteus TaxID=3873 RepID=A0AAV1WKE9_LUPLU
MDMVLHGNQPERDREVEGDGWPSRPGTTISDTEHSRSVPRHYKTQTADLAAVRRGETVLLVVHLTQTEKALTRDVHIAGTLTRQGGSNPSPKSHHREAATISMAPISFSVVQTASGRGRVLSPPSREAVWSRQHPSTTAWPVWSFHTQQR